MSYFTQMAGLAYHNFLSAAVGIALAIAVIRGIARREMATIGNFWVDMTRALLWVLLPACIVVALFLVSQGTVQSLKPHAKAQLVDPQTVQVTGADGKTTTQQVTDAKITLGPVASQEAIKMYGTNGGGFFNANSAHPFENPTPLTNFVQMLLIFSIRFGTDVHAGTDDGIAKHGWAVWGAMATLFLAGCLWLTRRRRVEIQSWPQPELTSTRAGRSRAGIWRERKCASELRIRLFLRRSRPMPAAVR